MNLFRKLLRCATPFAVLLVAACGGGGHGTYVGVAVAPPTVVTTLAGQAGVTGGADGTGGAASFNYPTGMTMDAAANIYVADGANSTIRKIAPVGVVSTLAGTAGVTGSADLTGAAASFNHPNAVAVDSTGNVYVADSGNYTIRKITPAGVVSTLAGTAGAGGSVDGTGAAARFGNPVGIAVDTAGNLYVADGGANQTVRKITPAGAVSTLAGTAGVFGSTDATGTAASFYAVSCIAIDSKGNLYVGDWHNRTIRKITPAGVVSTLAGSTGVSGSTDGAGAAAKFGEPMGIAVDATDNLYVSDFLYHNIRKVSPSGLVSTLAGMAGSNGNADGGSAPRFNNPAGIAVDKNGIVYVSDFGNNTIRQIGGKTHTIGGYTRGLVSTLILQNSNGDTKAAYGNFTFDRPVAAGAAYAVTVKTQPPVQTCTVTSGSGTATTDVSNIVLNCTAPSVSSWMSYRIYGSVSSLHDTLVLQNSNGELKTVPSNAYMGAFYFSPIIQGGAYNVTVATQPTGQTCTVTNGSGTASNTIPNVSVTCAAATYTIGGTVSGLAGPAGSLVLQDNNGDNLSPANGNFTFATPVAYGGAYNVTVLTQPAGQTCTVRDTVRPVASGAATANIGTLAVNCVSTYTVGGAVSGLTGTVVLQNNGGDNLSLSTNAPFTFATPVSGAYNVTVLTQPAGQTCTVTGGTGTAAANVSNVAVSCVTTTPPATYTVGGNVMGFNTGTFSGTLVLQNNGADNLVISPSASGIVPFTFATPISGAYSVTVLTQPTGGTTGCTVSVGGSGIASASSGTGVTVTCI